MPGAGLWRVRGGRRHVHRNAQNSTPCRIHIGKHPEEFSELFAQSKLDRPLVGRPSSGFTFAEAWQAAKHCSNSKNVIANYTGTTQNLPKYSHDVGFDSNLFLPCALCLLIAQLQELIRTVVLGFISVLSPYGYVTIGTVTPITAAISSNLSPLASMCFFHSLTQEFCYILKTIEFHLTADMSNSDKFCLILYVDRSPQEYFIYTSPTLLDDTVPITNTQVFHCFKILFLRKVD